MPPKIVRDADYWARVHIEGDRRKPCNLSDSRGGTMSSPVRWKSQPKENANGDAA